jgi:pentalenene oxygenase
MRVLATQQEDFDKGGPFMEASRLLVGNGIITCAADDHQRQLPLVQPAFTRRQVARHAGVMRQCALQVTSSWEDGTAIAIEEEMYRLSALVVARTLVSSPAGHHAAATMAQALPTLLQGMFRRMMMPWPWLHQLPTPANRGFTDALTRLEAAIAQLTAHYRRPGHGAAGPGNDGPGDDGEPGSGSGDVLSQIIHGSGGSGGNDPGDRLSDREVRDQILSLLAAGVETTATLLSWTCHTLARHPRAAHRLHHEVDQALAGRAPRFEDLADLPYTRLILTETLRLYPPTWILSRQAVHATLLRGFALPAGAVVIISPFALQRDPGVFPDPDAFVPERWLPDRVTAEQRRSFLAFGGGRRRCLGEFFGMTEAAIALATIATHWDLRPTRRRPIRPVPRLLLVPQPRRLQIRRRYADAPA